MTSGESLVLRKIGTRRFAAIIHGVTGDATKHGSPYLPVRRIPSLPLRGEKLPDRRALLLVLDAGEEALPELHDRLRAIEGQLVVHLPAGKVAGSALAAEDRRDLGREGVRRGGPRLRCRAKPIHSDETNGQEQGHRRGTHDHRIGRKPAHCMYRCAVVSLSWPYFVRPPK